jgi:hypothetical protein
VKIYKNNKRNINPWHRDLQCFLLASFFAMSIETNTNQSMKSAGLGDTVAATNVTTTSANIILVQVCIL